MPRAQWSAKRERQYQHIKTGLRHEGRSEALAEEIAARTVNKERAQHGEAEHPSAASLNDMPASRRGGQHSHQGPQGRTYRQLYEEARGRGLKGRSRMDKAALQRALHR